MAKYTPIANPEWVYHEGTWYFGGFSAPDQRYLHRQDVRDWYARFWTPYLQRYGRPPGPVNAALGPGSDVVMPVTDVLLTESLESMEAIMPLPRWRRRKKSLTTPRPLGYRHTQPGEEHQVYVREPSHYVERSYDRRPSYITPRFRIRYQIQEFESEIYRNTRSFGYKRLFILPEVRVSPDWSRTEWGSLWHGKRRKYHGSKA